MKPTAQCPAWCRGHDDEGTHMSAITELDSGWSVDITQIAGGEPVVYPTDPRGLLHAELVPGLTPDDAIRLGAALLNAGLAAASQTHRQSSGVTGFGASPAHADARCETGADYDRA